LQWFSAVAPQVGDFMEKIYLIKEHNDCGEDNILYITSDKAKAEKVLEIEEYSYMYEYQSTSSFTNQKEVTELENRIKVLEQENKRLNSFCMKQYGKTE